MTASTRPAGLYRTVLPLPGREKEIPAQRLILFHPNTDAGKPAVVLPNGLTDNRWTFGNRGFPVDDAAWPDTLVPLPQQGFYITTRELAISPQVTLPQGVLVQVGYTQAGEGVVFPGFLQPGNVIAFEKSGARLSDLQFDGLRAIDFRLLVRAPAPAGAPAPAAPVADGSGSVH